LIFFSRLPDEAEKTQFRFREKKGRGANNRCFLPFFPVLNGTGWKGKNIFFIL
jgi:hypothetical protein